MYFYPTPRGIIKIEFTERGVTSVTLHSRRGQKDFTIKQGTIIRKFNRYFKGEPVTFDFPLDLRGLSKFTCRVLNEVRKIPYGQVVSYRTLASRIKNPKASRAVGQALKRNPLPIIIPCHRVVRSDRKLGGYAWGVDWKRYLLTLEKAL
jgi:methylated-DNA-[protein]-cysteine S-methyltransferase